MAEAISINLNNNKVYFTAEEAKASYSLENTIQKIRELSPNVKLCLFIGRRAHEALPEEPDTVWVSGDIGFGAGKVEKNRLHIQTNFNEIAQHQMEGLFDTVVIDQSTVKFLEENFIEDFTALLKPSPTSTFIFEECPYASGYNFSINETKNHFYHLELPGSMLIEKVELENNILKQYLDEQSKTLEDLISNQDPTFQEFQSKTEENYGITISEMKPREIKNNFRAFLIRKLLNEQGINDPEAIAYKNAQRQTMEHTNKFFHSVQYINNAPFPYHTNYLSLSGKDRYLVATFPKSKNILLTVQTSE